MPSPTLPLPSPLAVHWCHDPAIVYLNHGSFGACPRAVLEAQDRYRARMEAEAVRFFVTELDALLDGARAALASFVGCAPADLAFVPNATFGVTTALESFGLKAGDEVVSNTHEYPACMNNLRRIAGRAGARIITAEVPFPVRSPDEVVDSILRALTPRTRLALVSHVTSSSGLVTPIERIVKELAGRGIEVLVDGAHAPGFVDLDIRKIGAAFYTANCHKWICSPKGSALLYVREDWRARVRPVVLSNFAESGKPGRSMFHTEFDYVGTNDLSGWIAVKDAIEFMGSILPGGWPEVRRRNRELALKGRDLICRALSVEPAVPDSMLASLSTIPLPAQDPERAARLARRPTRYADALQDALLDRHRIQVPVWAVGGRPPRVLRISAQLYNSIEQYEYLAAALESEIAAERRL